MTEQKQIIPLEAHGLSVVSFGFFLASLVIAPLGIGAGLAALDWLVGTLSSWIAMLGG